MYILFLVVGITDAIATAWFVMNKEGNIAGDNKNLTSMHMFYLYDDDDK
jgi:hypothetical protein